jgi:hypothetical protein
MPPEEALRRISSCGERKVECGFLSRLRFQPDSPAVAIHDLLADHQADPVPPYCSRVYRRRNISKM